MLRRCATPRVRLPPLVRCLCKKPKDPKDPKKPKTADFGHKHAGDEVRQPAALARESAREPPAHHLSDPLSLFPRSQWAVGQTMHDAGKGRYAFVGDFVASMNKGPVKLDFGKDAKPISDKQKEIDELNERNLKLIQRSLVIGSALAGIGMFVGWKLTKAWYGVRDVREFGEVMSDRMPKVSGKLEDSALGRRLQETSEKSRDAISESPELTDWRRSLRGKFNTEEGAMIARANSLVLAKKREKEKSARNSREGIGSTVAKKPMTEAEAAYEAVAAGGDEADAEAAAAKVAIEAVAAEAAAPAVTEAAATTATAAASAAAATATAVVADVAAKAGQLTRTISEAILPASRPNPPSPKPSERGAAGAGG